jgi:CheY-like chemotaxis protein
MAIPHEREQALAAGCAGHIEKPIDTRNFIAQLHGFLARAEPVPPPG